jgi:hypothetical protein
MVSADPAFDAYWWFLGGSLTTSLGAALPRADQALWTESGSHKAQEIDFCGLSRNVRKGL